MSKTPNSLPVRSILTRAFKIPAQSPGLFIRALLITGCSLLFVEITLAVIKSRPAAEWSSTLWVLYAVFRVVFGYFMFLFVITHHRLILLGEGSVPRHGILTWTKREWKFLGWFFVTILMFPAVFFVCAAPLFILSALGVLPAYLDFLILVTGLILALYYTPRISMVLPGCAVDEEMSIKKALKMTKNNGWRSALLLVVLLLVVALVFWGAPQAVYFFVFGLKFTIESMGIYYWFLLASLLIVSNVGLLYLVGVLSLSFEFFQNLHQKTNTDSQ